MTEIRTRAKVTKDHKLIADVPSKIKEGSHEVIIFLKDKGTVLEIKNFPVDSVGKWPENLSLSREDLYNNDRF